LSGRILVFRKIVTVPPASAWSKLYGGSGWDYAHAVIETSSGDIIVAGKTNSFGAGKDDILILRRDAEGNIKWQKTYGGTEFEVAWSVVEAAMGIL